MSPERETERLTPRKQEVWALMAQGLSNGGIAGKLAISQRTAEIYIGDLYNRFRTGYIGYPEKDPRAEAVLEYIAKHPDFHNPLNDHQLLKPFSEKEKGVLLLAGKGFSKVEIARKLTIKPSALNYRSHGILTKLNIDHKKQNQDSHIMIVLAAKVPHFFLASPEIKPQIFTPREQEVWALMAQGLLNEGIAKQLVIRPRTVEHHINNLYSKLGIDGKDHSKKDPRAEAVLEYIAKHPEFYNPFNDSRSLNLFSKRQKGVLAFVGQGFSNPAIGKRLSISRRTVESHIARILMKLGINPKTEGSRIMMVLAAKAIQEKTKEQT